MDTASPDGKGTATASLRELVQIAGLPVSTADYIEINGADPVYQTRYKIVAPGAAVVVRERAT